jgi:integrase
MNGTITKIQGPRGDVWRLFVSAGRDERGRRIRVTKRVRGSKAEANRQLRALISEIESGTHIKPSSLSLSEFLTEKWLPVHRLAVRATTFHTDVDYINRYITPRIGGVALSSVSREQIQELYSALLTSGGRGGASLSPGTVRKVHQILRQALGTAVRWELISRNVVELVDPPALVHKTVRVLRPAEIDALLLELDKSSPWASAPSMLAFHTGLRRSEILGLTWADLDTHREAISVRQGYHRLDDGTSETRPPKSRRSRRLVPLTRSSLDVLKVHRLGSEHDAELLGRELKVTDFVFAGIDGEPYRPDSLSAAFRHAAQRAELPGVHFHVTRHTHASLLLAAGVHPKVVSERLGHASIAFTLDTYSHVMPGLQEAAAEALDRILSPGGQSQIGDIEPLPSLSPDL